MAELDSVIRHAEGGLSRGSSPGVETVVSVDGEEPASYDFNGRHMMVTYANCPIEDPKEFYRLLKERVPAETEVYGCQERHVSGRVHYHAVMRLPKRYHWRDARSVLLISQGEKGEERQSLNISKPQYRQRVDQFLEACQTYCEKDSNPVLFGKRIEAALGREAERRRVFRDVVEAATAEEARELIRKHDPFLFVTRWPAIDAFLKSKPAARVPASALLGFEVQPWRVPDEMEQWKRDHVDRPKTGRSSRRPLVIVGPAKAGKTAWAINFGDPVVMDGQWNLRNVFEGATHVVVNDVNPLQFGPTGASYWRQVLGGQPSFEAHDRYAATRKVRWDLPVIWTSNYDNSPLNYPEVAEYLYQCDAVTVCLGDGEVLYDSTAMPSNAEAREGEGASKKRRRESGCPGGRTGWKRMRRLRQELEGPTGRK